MDVVKKSCRLCRREFNTAIKQQRYCDHICAYKAKKTFEYRKYLEGKMREATQPTFSTMYGLDWASDNDLAGINLGKERYQE